MSSTAPRLRSRLLLLAGAAGLAVLAAAGVATLAAPAHADLTAPRPRRAAWMNECVAALEKARAEYARTDPRFTKLDIETIAGDTSEHSLGECAPHTMDYVGFQMPTVRGKYDLPVFSGSIKVRNAPDGLGAGGWKARVGGGGWERHDAGRDAELSILDDRDGYGPAFTAAFQPALDRCLVLAPAAPAPPLPPSDAALAAQCRADAPTSELATCVAAERAAVELESDCLVEGAAIGIAGQPGQTLPRLERIAALGERALPILLRLAGSAHAEARAEAAMGLAKLDSDAARAALDRLARDRAPAQTIDGCIAGTRPVASFVARGGSR